jgi:2-polyprenyl-6-methoxyphenol hydroxylase-like FAD-dependent oxidoreductase
MGDLLIGADGPNSTVRQLILPGYEPRYTILDLGVPQMAFGRIALVADALLTQNHDVPNALNRWESNQLRLGMYLWKASQDLGDRSPALPQFKPPGTPAAQPINSKHECNIEVRSQLTFRLSGCK